MAAPTASSPSQSETPDANLVAESTSSGVFSALRDFPSFRRLWLGSVSTQLGQWMQATALGWLALNLTDSKSFVGLVAFASGIPFLLFSVPAGAMIDRFDRRKVLMACQALAMVLAIVVAVDVLAGHVQPWHLILAALLNGTLQAVLSPTQQSLVPGLVPPDRLTQAVGLMSAGGNMTRVIGPSLAGALIGFLGTGEAFVAQAVALVVALSLIATAAFPPNAKSTSKLTIKSAFEGVGIVARRPDLRGLFLLAAIPTFFVFPYISFMSVYARDILKIGPEGLGLLMASSGTGAVIGSLLVAGRNKTASGKLLVTQTAIYGIVIAIFAMSTLVYVSVPLLVLAGLLGAMFMAANNALIQTRITDDIRGRVMGTYLLTWGLMPLGAMPLGLLSDRFGIQVTVACCAIISSVLIVLLGIFNPEIMEI